MIGKLRKALADFGAPRSSETKGEILPPATAQQMRLQKVTEFDVILDKFCKTYVGKCVFFAGAIVALFSIINVVLSSGDEALFVFLFFGFMIVLEKCNGHVPFFYACTLGLISTLILPFFSNPRNLIVFFLWYVGSLYSISWLVSKIFIWLGILRRAQYPPPPKVEEPPGPFRHFEEQKPFGNAGFAGPEDLRAASKKGQDFRPQFDD